MTHESDSMPEALRNAAREYNNPPELSAADLDAMWRGIDAAVFTQTRTPDAQGRKHDFGRFFSIPSLLPLAAVLLLGVTIGRFTFPRKQGTSLVASARAPKSDSVGVPEPYQSATSQYLGQAVALLAALPSEVREGRTNEPYMGRAHDLLLTTRLLLDSPAAADPRFRTLLEDLELVLAQVIRLQSAQSTDEMELIRQALEQRDVLPRLRTAVADISADD